jgi:hypothetical protein
VIKKSRTRGGYSPLPGCENTNPQWVVAPVEKKITEHFFMGNFVLLAEWEGQDV